MNVIINRINNKMMKNLTKIVAMLAIICVLTLKASDNENVSVSDIVLANMEALAEPRYEEPGGDILCSRSCGDGVGRCWTEIENTSYCKFSGYQSDSCVCN